MDNILPDYVRPFLWSYDLNNFDLKNKSHRDIIIFNILNYGSFESLVWLLKNFSKEEIKDVVLKGSKNSWDKKSLSLSSLLFNVFPVKNERFS